MKASWKEMMANWKATESYPEKMEASPEDSGGAWGCP
jgi:hypothetical protein